MVTLGGLGSISGAVVAAIVLTLLPEILRAPPSVWPWGVLIAAGIIVAIFIVRRSQGILSAAAVVAVCIGYELVRLLARWWRIDLSEFRMIIYSLLLIFMMLLRPQGLLGGRELFPRRGVPRRDAVPTEDRDDLDTMRVPT
jgi:branched-chain amino acid transport system permease protein